MSCVIHDVKLLESPFPHGSWREQIYFGCWPLQRSSFKFYKVFMGLKVILGNEILWVVLGMVLMGFLRLILVIKLKKLTLFY